MDSSSTPKASRFPALDSLPPRFCLPPDEREQAIRDLREQLSCVPFYAKRAARREAETGDPMAYWREFYGSAQYTLRPRAASSTAVAETSATA